VRDRKNVSKNGQNFSKLERRIGLRTELLRVADALRSELGTSRQAVKTIVRWTGAEVRTVKNWLAGANGPSGPHLITLFRHSDAVLGRCLLLAGRERALANAHLPLVRTKLRELLEILEITAD